MRHERNEHEQFSLNSAPNEDEHELYRACYNGNFNLAKQLLEAGVDPNCRDEDEWTPLHAACAQGHRDIAQLLVDDYKADVNVLTKTGTTPLFQAVKYGKSSIARYLVSKSKKKKKVFFPTYYF